MASKKKIAAKAAKARANSAAGTARPYVQRLIDDDDLRDNLRSASESLRAASEALREPEKTGGSALGKLLFIAVIGAILALALSEDLRKKVLDQLFGAEEEFEYTSTTSTGQTASTA